MDMMDYQVIGASILLVLTGVYIAGRREADGMWGLGLWDARVFATFLTFFGIGVLSMWGSRYEEVTTNWSEVLGLLAGITFTVAVIAGSAFDKDAPIPDVAKNLVALLGLGLLFASGLTITVQAFYNPDFTGEFLAISMPLFPMDAFLASIWAAGLLSLCGAALLGLVASARKLEEDSF